MDHTDCWVFAGGGSGGHLYPGIAVADELCRRDAHARILFLGSQRPIETRILQSTRFEHLSLPVEPLNQLRRAPWSFCWRSQAAYRQAAAVLAENRPRAVIGLGGYISAPTVFAAWRRGIPVILLEQNVIPGSATRWLSRLAQHVCLSFAETAQRLPRRTACIVTGNPVRAEIAALAEHHRETTSVASPSLRTLLILGGSQGAESLNAAVLETLPAVRDHLAHWRIVHQTGPGRAESVRDRYRHLGLAADVEEFLPDMADRYVTADLVISRSGATTLAELACAGCPAILVPYPFTADQHQAANADALARRGAALRIDQQPAAADTAQRLAPALCRLLTDQASRASMSKQLRESALPAASRMVVDLLLRLSVTGSRAATQHQSPDSTLPDTNTQAVSRSQESAS